MTLEIGRRLLASGAATDTQVRAALFLHVNREVPFLLALRQGGVATHSIDAEATRSGAPQLHNVVAALHVVRQLPVGMCERLLALPVRVDPITATVDVAVADPFNIHVRHEFAFHLGAPVRLVHAPLETIEAAIAQAREELHFAPAKSPRARTKTPALGSAAPRIAVPTTKGNSDIPIPLVRRSKPPPAPANDADDPGRITQDAIVLDPGSLPAATPSFGDFGEHGIDASSLDIVIPKSAGVPTIDAPPETSPAFTEAVVGLERALDELRVANTRDDVVLATLHGMSAVARRVGVFAARRNAFTGWACTHSFAHESAFRSIRIDRHADTILAHAAAEGWYLGSIPDDPQHRQLITLIGDPEREIAIVAVRLRGRPAMLVLAAQLLDTMIATRTAERIANASAQALVRVVRSEKLNNR